MRSMTGYGNAEFSTKNFTVKVEIKSLNGKFLELNLRTPKVLGEKEVELRQTLQKWLTRGSVLCTVSMERNAGSETMVKVNNALATAYYTALKSLADTLEAPTQDIFRTVVNMPDVLKADEGSLDDEDWAGVLNCAEQAFRKFDEFRLKEGNELSRMLREHNEEILKEIPAITTFESERKDFMKEKLRSSVEEQKEFNSDPNRFEQELMYYLEKLDISEEKNRLISHCNLFKSELKKEGSGKTLGFISQEMGREINTLGSKAGYAPMQEIVIRMKEQLEKIKEQSLNVL